jgi:hypothetical protein
MDTIVNLLTNSNFTHKEYSQIKRLAKKKISDIRAEHATINFKKDFEKYIDEYKNFEYAKEVFGSDITKKELNKIMRQYKSLFTNMKITKVKVKRLDYMVNSAITFDFEIFNVKRYCSGTKEGEECVGYRCNGYYIGETERCCEEYLVFDYSHNNNLANIDKFYAEISKKIKLSLTQLLEFLKIISMHYNDVKYNLL